MIFLAAMWFKETGGVYSTPFYTDYSHDEHHDESGHVALAHSWFHFEMKQKVYANGVFGFDTNSTNSTKKQKKSSRISPVHLCGVFK